jgi:hypothetical protein
MSTPISGPASGIGVLGLLGVAFIVLKLINIIDWSWWYVTLPFWIEFAIPIGIAAIWLVVWLILRFTKNAKKSK